MSEWNGPIEKIDDWRWRIPARYKEGMRTEGVIYASESMMQAIRHDQALEQVANVAFLPGIVGRSLAMPDIHWGYGFPIGGVAATEGTDGVISPGGVGFDINCGVRIIRTHLTEDEVGPRVPELLKNMIREVPSGVGSEGRLVFREKELKQLLVRGARFMVERGFGWNEDTDLVEEQGAMTEADPAAVSQKALKRGLEQAGSLGSGNHFLEIEVVDRVFRPDIAGVYGLFPGQVIVTIHTGSRGFGHQVCTDQIRIMHKAMIRYGIQVPDRQLACAPFDSPEGRNYLAGMACAANYAWANRQLITHRIRECFERVFGQSAERMGMSVLYDLAHNIAKLEDHQVEDRVRRLCVHRKGATRAFGPHHPSVPDRYRAVGQPVLIPGDMGTGSYVLAGTGQALTETFGSACHGAGRLLSRHQAVLSARGRDITQELAERKILVAAHSSSTLREEIPEAYKDIHQVVEVVEQAGLSTRVVYARPLGVAKG